MMSLTMAKSKGSRSLRSMLQRFKASGNYVGDSSWGVERRETHYWGRLPLGRKRRRERRKIGVRFSSEKNSEVCCSLFFFSLSLS